MDEHQRYWFAAPKDGRGWGRPLTWQGWLTYALWISAFFVAFPHLRVPERPVFSKNVALFALQAWSARSCSMLFGSRGQRTN
jgi:hypothetical protein